MEIKIEDSENLVKNESTELAPHFPLLIKDEYDFEDDRMNVKSEFDDCFNCDQRTTQV